MGAISAEALDMATANFDESFQRMPIETEDYERQQQAAGHAPISDQELNEKTFRGFTYDGDLPPPENGDDQSSPGRPPPRGGGDGEERYSVVLHFRSLPDCTTTLRAYIYPIPYL